MYIKVNPSVSNWSPMFNSGVEEPLILVKIQFPLLIVNIYDENLLLLTAGNVREVLKEVLAILQVTFSIAAPIKVKVNLEIAFLI